MAKTKIHVAAATLVGAKPKGETVPFRLLQGEELTAEAKKKLGLGKNDIDELVERGMVVEMEVRAAEGSASGEFEAMKARADKAEGDARELDAELSKAIEEKAALAARVEELEAELAEAKKA